MSNNIFPKVTSQAKKRHPTKVHLPPRILHSVVNTKHALQADLTCLRNLRQVYSYSSNADEDYDIDDLFLLESFIHEVSDRHRKAQLLLHNMKEGLIAAGKLNGSGDSHEEIVFNFFCDLLRSLDSEIFRVLKWLQSLGGWCDFDKRLLGTDEDSSETSDDDPVEDDTDNSPGKLSRLMEEIRMIDTSGIF